MRVILTTISVLLIIQVVQSQNYVNPDRLYYTQIDTGRPWPHQEVKWALRIYRFGEEISYGNTNYRILEYTEDENLQKWIDSKLRYREENNVVYYVWNGSPNRELIMYDWNANVGDTTPSYLCSKVFKREVLVQTGLGDRVARSYHYTNGGIRRAELPQIGGMTYPFFTIELCTEDIEDWELTCVYEKDSLIFKRHENRACVPKGEATSINDIDEKQVLIKSLYQIGEELKIKSKEDGEVEIYSISGRGMFKGGLTETHDYRFTTAGIYILRIKFESDRISTERLVVN